MRSEEECGLCRALENEADQFLLSNPLYVILKTKKMKGHRRRIMIVSREHKALLDEETEKRFLKEFSDFCKVYFDEEPTYVLVDSTYASIPHHWHRIACDWYGARKEIKQLHYTPHVALRTNVDWEP